MVDELAKAITKTIYPILKPEGFKRIRRREFIRNESGIVQRLGFQVNSWGGRDFCVNVSANLIASNEFVSLQPGFRLSRTTDGGDLWLPSKTGEDAEASALLVIRSIREEAFPFFDKTRTVEGFSDLLGNEHWGSAHHLNFEKGVAAAYLGRISEAKRLLSGAIGLYEADGRDWCFRKIDQAKELIEALEAGSEAELLAHWELKNAKAHGIG